MLFSGVEMLKASGSTHGDVQVLIPLAEGVSLEMTGGLKLSQGIWHTGAPPEITATAPAGPFRLALMDPSEEAAASNESNNAACRLTLAATSCWDAANFTVMAWTAGKLRRETGLSFRSANHPRRLPGAAQTRAYAVTPSGAHGFLSAQLPSSGPASGLEVQGLVLRGAWDAGRIGGDADGAPAEISALQTGEDEVPAGFEASYRLDKAEGLQETCVLRGYHCWQCQSFNAGDDRDGDMWMLCSTCEYRVLTRNRGQQKKGHFKSKALRPGVGMSLKPPGMGARLDGAPGPDLILDALCYLGAGSWRKLQDLAGSDGRPALWAQGFSAGVAALGHIDVSYDARLRSPLSWAAAPPALSFTSSGAAVFAGFRNAALLAALEERLTAAGGILTEIPQDDGPTALVWTGLTAASARTAAIGLIDPHGRPVTIVEGFASAVADQAPSLSDLAGAMPAIRLEKPKELQQFDPGSGCWRGVSSIGGEGAYRGDYGGRRYVFADSSGGQREGSFALVKLLAARAAGLRLHGYDAASQTFQAVLGCEPPGLFQRALTACSGILPQRVGGRLLYRGVAPATAAVILTKLYT
ncbi:hypothetical protein D3C72_953570 [compost metagenome]